MFGLNAQQIGNSELGIRTLDLLYQPITANRNQITKASGFGIQMKKMHNGQHKETFPKSHMG